MRSLNRLFFLSLLFLSLSFSSNAAFGQETRQKAEEKEVPAYSTTPTEIRPYRQFHGHYKLFFAEEQPFLGPGRDKEAPKGLKSVKIGFLGPLEGSYEAPLGRRMLQGAILAIEDANREGGYNGIPFELVVRDDVGAWGTSSNKTVELNDEGVWAFLGAIDGQSTHIALRVVLKIYLPFVTSGSTDPTLTETRIPWYVRVNGDDRQMTYALAKYVYDVKKHERVAVLRVNNRYGRVGIGEFNAAARRLGKPILIEQRFGVGDRDFTMQLEKIKKSSADAIVLWADAVEGGIIMKQMRAMGITLPVYGNDRLVEKEFLEIAGKDAEGLVVTYPYNPDLPNPGHERFEQIYRERYGEEAEWFATHAYDGMNLIIDAIRAAGLNKARIRDYLTSVGTYHGITGEIPFDETWNDVGPVALAELRDGKFHFFPSPLDVSWKIELTAHR